MVTRLYALFVKRKLIYIPGLVAQGMYIYALNVKTKKKERMETKKLSSSLIKRKTPSSTDFKIKKSTGEIEFNNIRFLIHGDKHIGKTSLCSMFESPLMITFDPPNESIKYDYIYINKGWDQFTNAVDILLEDDSYSTYHYLVLDNIEEMYQVAMDSFCKERKVSYPSQAGSHGQGWKQLKDLFKAPLNKLLKSNYKLIATGHTVYKSIETPMGDTYYVSTIDASKACSDYFGKLFDMTVCFCYDSSNNKILKIRGGKHLEVDSRIKGHFLYPDGSFINEIPMGNSEEEGYANLKLAFDNKLPKPVITTKSKLISKK